MRGFYSRYFVSPRAYRLRTSGLMQGITEQPSSSFLMWKFGAMVEFNLRPSHPYSISCLRSIHHREVETRIVNVEDALQNILADRPHSRTHSLPAGRTASALGGCCGVEIGYSAELT